MYIRGHGNQIPTLIQKLNKITAVLGHNLHDIASWRPHDIITLLPLTFWSLLLGIASREKHGFG